MTPKKSGNKEVKKSKLEIELESAIADKLRLAAELDNTRKRFEAERGTIAERSQHEVIAKLFPIFDNFYRASTHAPAISDVLNKVTEDDFKKILNYVSGLRQIEKQLEAALAEMGLKRIAAKGQEFDPELHEAISHEESKDTPADHVIDEVEAGWLLNGKVLRPAKVRVSKG